MNLVFISDYLFSRWSTATVTDKSEYGANRYFTEDTSLVGLAINNKHEAEQSFDPDGIVPSHPCLRVLCQVFGPDCRGSQEAILIHHRF